MTPNMLRNIPPVNELLESKPLQVLAESVSRNVVVAGVRSFLDNLRGEVTQVVAEGSLPSPAELGQRIADWIVQQQQPRLRDTINATGVLLHTGLGRAPLAQAALDELVTIGSGYSSLEIDLESGFRSQRHLAVQYLLTDLTGAESALVVNNNAGATVLTLAALAAGKEVIVSRGELVEIGDSYRLPDVMSVSGAILREVGTTNKTRIDDYAAAIGEETAALMRVHTSNYEIVGFTEKPSIEELVSLGRKHNRPVIDDIGSGAMVDFARYGVSGEPVAGDSVRAGAEVVLFSGDKLLGGPQCGIIVGRRLLLERIRKHPLMRALRVGKMTLAALAATLRLYQDQEVAERAVPLLALLSTPLENLHNRAVRMAPQIAATPVVAAAEPLETDTFLGGGSVPAQRIATWCVALRPRGISVDELARRLRSTSPPVVGRVHKDRLLLDLRSVFPGQDSEMIAAVEQLSD